MIVYRATNKINNKVYIGYTTKSLDERIKCHIYKSRSANEKAYFYLFKQALRKYGNDNFEWDILENCNSKEECCEKEIYYIGIYNTISPNGYNLTIGGNGGLQSKETRIKISNSVKEYWEKNKDSHFWTSATKEDRYNWAKKSWITKKKNGYVKQPYFHTSKSKDKISATKNSKNKIKWINSITGEIIELSLTNMSQKTGLSIGTFSHLYKERTKTTKCGWKLFKIKENNEIH